MRKKFQITLILVFEVIVQPPKTLFLTFLENKIMKITYSEPPTTTNKYHRVPKKPSAITLLAGGDDRETTFNHEIWVDSALGHK